jgi:hypothetical protein
MRRGFITHARESRLDSTLLQKGLGALLFFDKGISWNYSTSVLLWIGLISLILLLISVLKLNPIRNETS